MAGQAEQFYNAKDVEEAVQRGIQRGIASFRNEDLRVPGVTSLSSSGGLNVSGVISRARDLLRSNIGSVSSSLQASVAQQPKRRRIGHQYTHKSVKQPEQKTLEISVVDFMAREEFVDENGIIPPVLPNYNLGKDDILFSGTVDLLSNDKEDAIRTKITEVLASRIPGILPEDFSFVKVSRKQVCTPACKEGQKWDYPQVKAIAGQGKLYVRLLKPQATMGQEEPSTLNDHPSSIHVPEYEPQSLNECIVGARMSAPTICSPQPSTSTACVSSSSINRGTLSNKGTELQSAAVNILTCQQTCDEDEQKDIDNLRTMFPDKDKSYLSEVRRNNITLNDTIDDILGMEALEVPCSFKDALVSHRLKYASEEEVNRINVDRESLWEDSIITFKSPKFDPRGTLRVKFSGEAGLDAGGLRMEYCSLLAKAIFSSEASLFEGSSDRYVPIYNASAIQSDIFGLVGKMMSYMIFHHDVPFRCISPAVYEYLVTGDLDKAARLSSVLDVPDWEIREVISKLNDIKTVEDLRTFLLENPNVRDVMNVAGWVKDITVTNKGYAAMNLLIHEVLTKRKFAMDQIRRGLYCLEVLSLIQKYPDEMKEYFVKADKADITPDVMIREVFANANGKEDSQEKEQARKFFVQSLDVLYDDQKDDGMRKVLMYATARNSIPPLGFEEKIQLDYRSDGSSTFLRRLASSSFKSQWCLTL